MGNHTAGRAMGKAAEMALEMRTDQKALDLLDKICEPWRGCDAEFEGEDPKRPGYVHPEYSKYTDPNGPMGLLIIEAFGDPDRDYMRGWPEDADAVDQWWDGPYGKFRARYEFC